MDENRQIRILVTITAVLAAMALVLGFIVPRLAAVPRLDGATPETTAGAPWAGPVLVITGTVLVLLIPVLLSTLWWTRARERDAVVPEFLSFVPNPEEKPWLVHLLFYGEALDFNDHGLSATLLDLHRRGVLEITKSPENQELSIRILQHDVDDPYERRVMSALRAISIKDVVDTRVMRKEIYDLPDRWSEEVRGQLAGLTAFPEGFNAFSRGRAMSPLQVGALTAVSLILVRMSFVTPHIGLYSLIIILAFLFLWVIHIYPRKGSRRHGEDPGISSRTLSPASVQVSRLGTILIIVLAAMSAWVLIYGWGQIPERDQIVAILLTIVIIGLSAIPRLVFSTNTTYGDIGPAPEQEVVGHYLVDGRELVLPLVVLSLLLFVGSLAAMLMGAVPFPSGSLAIFLGFTALVQSVLAWSFPPTLFGRWKDDYYQEKLQWDAFGRFLSDMALMEKYAPEDLSRWGDWLVYGTALGVGDKVMVAMDALNIHIPDLTAASGGKWAPMAERRWHARSR